MRMRTTPEERWEQWQRDRRGMTTPPGLYRKFDVTRTDGRSAPGQKHHECRYFVLDLNHDEFSFAALAAYADACEGAYPELAADLRKQVEDEMIMRAMYDSGWER